MAFYISDENGKLRKFAGLSSGGSSTSTNGIKDISIKETVVDDSTIYNAIITLEDNSVKDIPIYFSSEDFIIENTNGGITIKPYQQDSSSFIVREWTE